MRTYEFLFTKAQAGEARPFMGDLTFFAVARRLASARVPTISLSTTGRETLLS